MSIPRLPIAVVACLAMALAGCSSGSTSKGDDAKSSSEVTLTNCGNKVTYPKIAQRLYANDGNIIAMALSAGAAKQIAAVSSLGDDKTILAAKYGSHVIDNLHEAVKGYPTLESIIANKPDVVVAGWNYGFSEESNLTRTSSMSGALAVICSANPVGRRAVRRLVVSCSRGTPSVLI